MTVVCPMCGTRLDPGATAGCAQCPLSGGCALTCCPACGYSWVEPDQTTVGRWLGRWLRGGSRATTAGPAPDPYPAVGSRTLADVPPNRRARVCSCDRLPDDRRRHLRAYGLIDGGVVAVVQQTPATVIRFDHLEIALETDLARNIIVEVLGPDEALGPSQPASSRTA